MQPIISVHVCNKPATAKVSNEWLLFHQQANKTLLQTGQVKVLLCLLLPSAKRKVETSQVIFAYITILGICFASQFCDTKTWKYLNADLTEL